MGRDHCIVVDTSDFSSKKQGGSPVQKRLESRTKGEGITMEDIEKSLLEAEGRRAVSVCSQNQPLHHLQPLASRPPFF